MYDILFIVVHSTCTCCKKFFLVVNISNVLTELNHCCVYIGPAAPD